MEKTVTPSVDPGPSVPAIAPALATPQPVGLGEATLAGATWLVIQQVAVQFLNFGSKVAVLRWVSKEDIGLATLALTVCSFLSLIQPASLTEILIQRQKHLRRWINSAFYMSFIAAAAILIVGAIAAFVSGISFKNTFLIPLIFCGTISAVLSCATVVFSAELSIRFQFRTIAVISTANALCASLLTVVMAYFRLGALVLLIPSAVATLLSLILLFQTSQFRPHGRLHVRRWKYLIGDGLLLTAIGFFANVTMQADNFFIGVYQSKASLAVYAMAYSLSFQFAQLAGRSLRGALLPAFSSVAHDAERRNRAYLQMIRLLAVVCVPACILVIPAVPAGIRLVFSKDWDEAAPLAQVFLLTMGYALISGLSVLTIQARSLLTQCVWITAFGAVLFVAVVWPVAAHYSIFHVACAVTCVYAFVGLLYPILGSLPSAWGTKGRILLALVVPFLLSLAGLAAGWAAANATGLPPTHIGYAVVASVVGPILYVVLARLILPETTKAALERISKVVRRVRR